MLFHVNYKKINCDYFTNTASQPHFISWKKT